MNQVSLHEAPVISNQEIAQKIFWMKLDAANIANHTQPGQFINIQTNPGGEPIWRRPFSVARVSGTTIEIIYKAIGRGTFQMAALKPGETADIIGPLGNAFTLQVPKNVRPLLIGGGLGFAPLVILRDVFVNQGMRPVLFMGAPTEVEHFYREDPDADLYLTSDDGTLGLHGFVTDALGEFLSSEATDDYVAYSCGPEAMMSVVAELCDRHGVPLELSIEREMACGIGLCQGCAIEQVVPHKKFALVCKDGPIFNSRKLAFLRG